MRSAKTWGKVVEYLLNRGWIGCLRVFTSMGVFTNRQVFASGNMRVVRFLAIIFPSVFTQPKDHSYNLLNSWFSPLSTPPIISETN